MPDPKHILICGDKLQEEGFDAEASLLTACFNARETLGDDADAEFAPLLIYAEALESDGFRHQASALREAWKRALRPISLENFCVLHLSAPRCFSTPHPVRMDDWAYAADGSGLIARAPALPTDRFAQAPAASLLVPHFPEPFPACDVAPPGYGGRWPRGSVYVQPSNHKLSHGVFRRLRDVRGVRFGEPFLAASAVRERRSERAQFVPFTFPLHGQGVVMLADRVIDREDADA